MAFTNYIQQITATNGTTHDLVDTSASHYIKGTQTSSTNAWTGALPDGVSAYYDGLSIDYFLPYAGTSSAATLNLGSKGAKPVYIGNGTSAVTTHFPQYSVIHLTYIINSSLNSGNGCWKATSYYNTNSGGTITGVTAGTGLSGGGTSGAVTLNHSNSITAQTTQAVYPIKIDAQGHISAYGSAVTIPTDTNTWRKVQLNGTDKLGTAISTNPLNLKAGTNMSITESSGTFTFAATDTNTTYALSGALSSHKFTSTLTAGGSGSGTSTSDFTLAAGTGITITDDTSNRKMTIACSVSNTDENVKSTTHTAATTYYLTGSTSSDTTTGGLNKHASLKAYTTADSGTTGYTRLDLGNTTSTASAGGKSGVIRFYGTGATYYGDIQANAFTANRTYTLPNQSGTIALTSDIPSYTDTNTWRKVQLDGTDKLGTAISTNPLNLKAGTNVSITESSGTFTFSATDTDTKVTSSANHYTPSTASGNDKTASASGATAAWSIDVVKGITINTDGKGHITGLSVTSGKIPANPNTDEKLKTVALTSGTTYYPILATGANAAANRQVDSTIGGLKYKSTAGTTSTVGTAYLYLGNNTASGTANNEKGILTLYGDTAYKVDIATENSQPTANRTIYLPSYAGTMYLTCASTTDAVGGATTAPVYVDNTGCIQAVTSIPYSLLTDTPTIPDALDVSTIANSNLFTSHLITNAQYCNVPKFTDCTSFQNASINAGQTTTTATLQQQSSAGYIQIIDIIAWDGTTGEKVIVDWTPSARSVSGNSITINISIASAYTHTIGCLILFRQMFGM